MIKTFGSTRRFAALAIAALSLGVAGCKDEDVHEVEVDFMRIIVGGQVVMVNSTGAVTGGPIDLFNGMPQNLRVEFLNANMADALGEHADDFQANLTTPAGIIFGRTGAFIGTLTGTINGTSNVAFELLHIEENHEDFGPFSVSVRVVSPPIIGN